MRLNTKRKLFVFDGLVLRCLPCYLSAELSALGFGVKGVRVVFASLVIRLSRRLAKWPEQFKPHAQLLSCSSFLFLLATADVFRR